MEGDRTPIHRLVWEYVPFASSVRTELRLYIVMPIFIMLLLSWLFLEHPFMFRLKKFSIRLHPYVPLAFIALFLIFIYSVLSAMIKPEISIFSPKYIRNIPMKTIMTVTLVGIISLVMLILYGTCQRAKQMLGILMCLAILFHIGWTLHYGIFVTERQDQPSFDQMKLQKKASINITVHPGEGLFSSAVTKQMDHSFMEPSLGKIYTSITPVSGQHEAYEKMRRNRLSHQIFVENYDHQKARLITDKSILMRKGTVDLIYSSYNRLQFRVISEKPAFFGLSYPYTGHWSAWVNGNQVRTYRANGASHAVEIPSGESLIEFRYWSRAAFWGIVISGLTFVFVGLYACFISLGGLRRIMATAFLLVAAASLVMLWNYSLYTGDNLGTRYAWTYTPPESKPNNIAYGKKTSNLPVPQGIFYMWYLKGGQYINHSGRIVDGNTIKGFGYKMYPKGFTSIAIDLNGKVTHLDKNHVPPKDNPSITIDLNNEQRVNYLNIYASKLGTSMINCNFELFISQDQNNWKSVSIVPELRDLLPNRIELDSPQIARYIRLQTSDSCKAVIDEVEIF
jgi:hypothetical protein